MHYQHKTDYPPRALGDGKPIGHTREDYAIMAVLDELRTKAYNKFLLMQAQDINVTPEILKETLLGKDQVKRNYPPCLCEWQIN